jgi:hypothetical protein
VVFLVPVSTFLQLLRKVKELSRRADTNLPPPFMFPIQEKEEPSPPLPLKRWQNSNMAEYMILILPPFMPV